MVVHNNKKFINIKAKVLFSLLPLNFSLAKCNDWELESCIKFIFLKEELSNYHACCVMILFLQSKKELVK